MRRSMRPGCGSGLLGVIGSRVHPRTGVPIVYVASVPADDADAVAVGEELTEVRWAGATEAGELMGDMFEEVRRYLARRMDDYQSPFRARMLPNAKHPRHRVHFDGHLGFDEGYY